MLQKRQKKKTKKRKYKNDLNKKAMCFEAMFSPNSVMIYRQQFVLTVTRRPC